MLLTLLSSLFGGLLRLAPEVLNFLSKKDDQAHELAMLDKQLAADAQRAQFAKEQVQVAGQVALDQINAQGAITLDTAGLDVLKTAIQSQAVLTGIKWVDGLSQLIRPLLTIYWCVVLETLALGAHFYVAYVAGHDAAAAFISIWGDEEKALVGSIFTFWFLDRAIRKAKA